MADTPYQIKLLTRRLKRAEEDALDFAAQCDALAERFAIALNALSPHNPDLVAELMGVKTEAPVEAEDPGVPGAEQA